MRVCKFSRSALEPTMTFEPHLQSENVRPSSLVNCKLLCLILSFSFSRTTFSAHYPCPRGKCRRGRNGGWSPSSWAPCELEIYSERQPLIKGFPPPLITKGIHIHCRKPEKIQKACTPQKITLNLDNP